EKEEETGMRLERVGRDRHYPGREGRAVNKPVWTGLHHLGPQTLFLILQIQTVLYKCASGLRLVGVCAFPHTHIHTHLLLIVPSQPVYSTALASWLTSSSL